jgi:hypothetical protein
MLLLIGDALIDLNFECPILKVVWGIIASYFGSHGKPSD